LDVELGQWRYLTSDEIKREIRPKWLILVAFFSGPLNLKKYHGVVKSDILKHRVMTLLTSLNMRPINTHVQAIECNSIHMENTR
jgi:hypothetical protein